MSPDDRLLAVGAGSDRYLIDLKTKARIPVKSLEPGDAAVGFTRDSSAILLFQPDNGGGRIFRIDLTRGTRTLIRAVRPVDPAGFGFVTNVTLALDGEHIAYQTGWENSKLFLLKLPPQ
jgi:hypothetical protein